MLHIHIDPLTPLPSLSPFSIPTDPQEQGCAYPHLLPAPPRPTPTVSRPCSPSQPQQIHKNKDAHIPICSDIKPALQMLNRALAESPLDRSHVSGAAFAGSGCVEAQGLSRALVGSASDCSSVTCRAGVTLELLCLLSPA